MTLLHEKRATPINLNNITAQTRPEHFQHYLTFYCRWGFTSVLSEWVQQLTNIERGKLVFPMNKPSDLLSSAKWSALKTYTEKCAKWAQQIVFVFLLLYVYIKKQLFCFKQRRWMVNCDVKIERGEEKGGGK